MSKKNIVVPNGMLDASLHHARNYYDRRVPSDVVEVMRGNLEQAILWLMEHWRDVVPPHEVDEIWSASDFRSSEGFDAALDSFLRRMFVSPEDRAK